MAISGTIHDLEVGKNVTAVMIDPAQLAALNAAWMHNALLLGEICLVVGFVIGAAGMYVYMRRKYGNIQ